MGIVTPFKGQVELLTRLAEQHRLESVIGRGRLRLGTAHRFQGDECDLITFSPVVAPGIGNYASNWIEEERNLLNVAVSRARSGLIVFGHPQAGEFGGTTLASLRRYAIEETARNLDAEGRYRTDSRPEQLLLDAMRTAGLEPVAKLNVSGYELDFALAMNGGGRLNVEVDGDQHIDDRGQRCRQDMTRDRVLTRAGWDVLRIPAWQCIWDITGAVRDIKRRLGVPT